MTVDLIARFGQYRVWLYGLDSEENDLLILPRHVTLEQPAGVLVSGEDIEAIVSDLVAGDA